MKYRLSVLGIILLCFAMLYASDQSQKRFANLRDPFSFASESRPKKTPIRLEGIVYADQKSCAAILVKGEKREVVSGGEIFEGYTLSSIGKKFVVLTRGRRAQKLIID